MTNLFLILSLTAIFSMTACSQAQQNPIGVKVVNSKVQLKPCPDSPNCINTEFSENTSHYIPPLIYHKENSAEVLGKAEQLILDMGGHIVQNKGNYIAATFTSMIFRFVDDFEIRNDEENHTLHIRSASRTGYSDFGVNKKRVEAFLKQFKIQK